ncbi:hypothetical protein C0995_011311 [Termitomyces sp. Mi166|nr:hypothetical protein C0995_011311 [Termitomyces sp. Mi166\
MDTPTSQSAHTDAPNNSHSQALPSSQVFLPSGPHSASNPHVDASGLPTYQHQPSLRPYPYPLQTSHYHDATNMSILVPLQFDDEANGPDYVRRRGRLYRIESHFVLFLQVQSPGMFAQAPLPPHFSGTMFATHSSIARPQHVCLDERERQRDRLVRLFKIPQFFDVVREGWGAAVSEERQKTLASASI